MLALTLIASDTGHTGETAPLMWRKTSAEEDPDRRECDLSERSHAAPPCGSDDAGPAAPATTARSPWASPRSAPRAAGAPPTPSRSRTSAEADGHRPEVHRRPGQAGEPDPGDPVLHPAEGRRHRLQPRRRDRLGRRPAGGQGRRHPGHPHRPRGRLRGHLALQDLPRLRLRGRGREGRPVAGRQRRRLRRRTATARSTWSSSRAPPAPLRPSTVPRASPTTIGRPDHRGHRVADRRLHP